MSQKHCAHHHRRKSLIRRTAATIVGLTLLLFFILLTFLIFRPTKPDFTLKGATIHSFNLTPPNLLTTSIQLNLYARNPNDRIGIYYDMLGVYVSYHDQQITVPCLLPSTYQGHGDVSIWSPIVSGENVPVSPYITEAIDGDLRFGKPLISVRVDGKVRWKVGSFITGRYHLNVNCPAYVTYGGYKNINGGDDINGDCHVDV